MTIQSDMALLAAGSHWDVRKGEFDTSGTGGWALFSSGFSARVYQNTSSGEVVISYSSTEFGWGRSGFYNDFISGNIPLALGLYGEQAYQAAQLYQRVKADLGDNITFTGHSLGGGLASVMAVWFDQPAYAFAPAPFKKSADSTQPTGLFAQYRGFAAKNIASCASRTRARVNFRKGCSLVAGIQHAHARTEVSQ